MLLTDGGRTASAQDETVPGLFRPDTLTVVFMGDMMMHTAQIEKARRKDGSYDFSSYFRLLEDDIRSADLAVANMEFTLSGKPYSGYPCFSAPDSYARYLSEVGFDIFLAANNHIFDMGGKGAERTVGIYRSMEDEGLIRMTGLAESPEDRLADTPLIVRRKGISLAFVNFTYGTNCGSGTHWPKTNYRGEESFISSAMARAEEKADYTIVMPHWGTEYELTHSQSQERTAQWLADNGADLIIGTHPHVVQDTSRVKGIPVAYSLGNAVSNMSAANTQLELMATLKIARKANGDLEMLPLELTWLWCSRPGGFGHDYTVIPVEKYIGRDSLWLGRWDYDKMLSTYERVRNKTGIIQ